MHDSMEEGQTRDLPMRILQILDSLTVERDPKNFVKLCDEIISVIQSKYTYMSEFHQIAVACEVLGAIPELQSLEAIFETSVIHLLHEKKRI